MYTRLLDIILFLLKIIRPHKSDRMSNCLRRKIKHVLENKKWSFLPVHTHTHFQHRNIRCSALSSPYMYGDIMRWLISRKEDANPTPNPRAVSPYFSSLPCLHGEEPSSKWVLPVLSWFERVLFCLAMDEISSMEYKEPRATTTRIWMQSLALVWCRSMYGKYESQSTHT